MWTFLSVDQFLTLARVIQYSADTVFQTVHGKVNHQCEWSLALAGARSIVTCNNGRLPLQRQWAWAARPSEHTVVHYHIDGDGCCDEAEQRRHHCAAPSLLLLLCIRQTARYSGVLLPPAVDSSLLLLWGVTAVGILTVALLPPSGFSLPHCPFLLLYCLFSVIVWSWLVSSVCFLHVTRICSPIMKY